MSDASPDRSTAGHISRLLIWSAIGLVFYVFSVGPVVYLMEHNIVSSKVAEMLAETVYYPLEWTYENIEPCERFFDWYLKFWR